MKRYLESVPPEHRKTVASIIDANHNMAILLSIKKTWLDKIESDEKTIELRKSFPNVMQTPFVAFCYETKNGKRSGRVKEILVINRVRKMPRAVFEQEPAGEEVIRISQESQVPVEDIREYLGTGMNVYGWEISAHFPIEEMFLTEFGIAKAPQSWLYLREKELGK